MQSGKRGEDRRTDGGDTVGSTSAEFVVLARGCCHLRIFAIITPSLSATNATNPISYPLDTK